MKYVTAVAHGRDGCARGERQQPAPRSRSARSSARAEAMRPTSAYSAATARVADSICECVRGFCAGSRSRWRWLLGAAGRRKRRAHGMPRRPTPHERSTSPAARLERACSAAMYAAACSACVVDAACGFGPWARARGALTRRAAAADDARGERESIGAAEGSALDYDVCGGGAARLVGSGGGLGRKLSTRRLLGAGSRSRRNTSLG